MALLINGAISAAETMTPEELAKAMNNGTLPQQSAAGLMTPEEEESLGKMDDATLPQQSAAGLMTHEEEEFLGKMNDETLPQQSAARLMTPEKEFLAKLNDGTLLTREMVLQQLFSAIESSEPGILTVLLSPTIPEDARPTDDDLAHALARAVSLASATASSTELDRAKKVIERFLPFISDRAHIITNAFCEVGSALDEKAVKYFLENLTPYERGIRMLKLKLTHALFRDQAQVERAGKILKLLPTN